MKLLKITNLIIIVLATIMSLNTTLAYYCSSDKIINSIQSQQYNIKINTDGGTINDNLVVKNNKIILPNIEKKDHTFLGYSTTENGNVVYKAKEEINIEHINNKNLYAIYESKTSGINAIEKVLSLAETDTDNIIKDDGTSDHNIRYYGADPNNYVKFNENDTDLWRIIGLFNNVEDSKGIKGQRLKLVRDVSIGKLSWDDDEKSVYDGWGVNEWPDADLMKLLNPNYDNYSDSTYYSCSYDYDLEDSVCQLKSKNEKVNNSLWWNNQKGLCYHSAWHRVTDCDFSTGDIKGPSTSAKSMIDDVVWNLGGIEKYFYDDEIGTTKQFYEYERNNKVYDCSEEDKRKCPRSTKWIGKVALIYPSDYGFATSGGSNYTRNMCLNMTLNHWGPYDDKECVNSNYMYKPTRWFLSPLQTESSSVMGGSYSGSVTSTPASFNDEVYPSIFLKQNVSIIGGTGIHNDPYILRIE